MLVSKSEIIPAVTETVSFVPSDLVASIVKSFTSNGSSTLYSVLWFVLFTDIAVTVSAGGVTSSTKTFISTSTSL